MIVLIVVLLGLSLYMFFPGVFGKVFRGQNELTVATENQTKQSAALLATSQIEFSKTLKNSPLSAEEVGDEFKEFVLPEAKDVSYSRVDYEGGRTGVFILYTLSNTTMRDVLSMANQNARSWIRLNSSYASEFGFADFTGQNNNSSARVLVFQNGTDLKLNIKTETK